MEVNLQQPNSDTTPKQLTVLGRNIRQCLDYIPWTVEQLARESGVSLRTISRWMNHGKRTPRPSYLDDVAKALHRGTGRVITHRDLRDAQFDIRAARGIDVEHLIAKA
jgi:transcriptional regulator with XRE-family HTH domain